MSYLKMIQGSAGVALLAFAFQNCAKSAGTLIDQTQHSSQTSNFEPATVPCVAISSASGTSTISPLTLATYAATNLARTVATKFPNAAIWAMGDNDGTPIQWVLVGHTDASGSYLWWPCNQGACNAGHTYNRFYQLKDTSGNILCTTNSLSLTVTN